MERCGSLGTGRREEVVSVGRAHHHGLEICRPVVMAPHPASLLRCRGQPEQGIGEVVDVHSQHLALRQYCTDIPFVSRMLLEKLEHR